MGSDRPCLVGRVGKMEQSEFGSPDHGTCTEYSRLCVSKRVVALAGLERLHFPRISPRLASVLQAVSMSCNPDAAFPTGDPGLHRTESTDPSQNTATSLNENDGIRGRLASF